MRLATVRRGGVAVVVALTDGGLRELTGMLPDPRTAVDPFVQLIEIIDELDPDVIAAQPLVEEHVSTFAPLVPRPGKIVAAPVNYHDHQEEMKVAGNVSALGFFLKSPASVLAHGGTVRLPYTDRRFDQEGELAFVIKKRARHIDPGDFLEYIAGYTCLLDITMRGGEDRSTRKSFDTFTPVGPYLVTPEEVGCLDDLTLRCSVNGILRQDADISDLIWGVPRFLSYASSVMTLEPGDIVTTGTPAGVGEIAEGDVIEVSIDRIGTLSVTVSAQGAVECPTEGAKSGPRPPAQVTPVRRRTSASELFNVNTFC
ncbi:fumarylacetoacetate hydrolase family protein [Amycolatopsis pithecellobii]|uniref:FAA hydrolase family protein n=1 Tax=Amycolatopsis pithecellobii TaxID=664692 RepID=A0A6N7YUL1_9PSEU|nr:fumarylacetoacetate hydrolase family protein [Amycolatopsis pithecellobii]MTD52543.1 FAA hydrolase family protein [Amycolatopsis pithecellobii]